jgi:hypothetical protein
LVTIDDDVLVPDKWDVLMAEACDKIPKLGITGVNVEPVNYMIRDINGIKVRPKTNGNLGGACLCLPSRVFKRVGYYRIYGQYGLEDSDMFVRLTKLGLLGAYIVPHGVHLDKDKDKVYRKVKTRAHLKGSRQLRAFASAKVEYEKTGNVYVPDIVYDPDGIEWKDFESLDGTITAKADIREIVDAFKETKGMLIGNKLEISMKLDRQDANCEYYIDTGAENRKLDKSIVSALIKLFKDSSVLFKLDGINE